MEQQEIDAGIIIGRLRRKWRLLFFAAFIGGLLGVGISKLMPKTYESKAVIYVQDNSVMSGLMSALPVSMLPNTGTNSGYYIALLSSDSMFRYVLNNLNLRSNPNFTTNKKLTVDKALKKIKKQIKITSGKNGEIEISVRSKNEYLAARIGNCMLDHLSSMVVTTSQRKQDFISEKLDQTDRDLREAEEKLMAFQEKHDLASLDDETKGLIDQLIELDKQLVALDVEKKQVESRLDNEGRLNELVDLEVHGRSLDSSREYLNLRIDEVQGRIRSLPSIASTYVRLKREVAVLSKTFELLTEQYQLVNISRHGEDGDYQIIDRAMPNRERVSPKTPRNAVICSFFAFFVTALIVASGSSENPQRPLRRTSGGTTVASR